MRALLAVLAFVLLAAPARAQDPGRWTETGHSEIPIVYYQGVTSDDAGHFYFDGIFLGLYRADAGLHEQARRDVAIPPAVTAAEGYNHIGDITYDRAEGGRVLLPVECYYPGRPGGDNSCRTGSFGVADPDTLEWRYYVKLDPAEIPKAMWAEVSPDGALVWTSSGDDLLAYSAAEIRPGRAAPLGAPLRAVRRLPGAVPPTGITGATFVGRRLFLAGQDSDLFQIWSVDTATGARRLEVERHLFGESEGLDTATALGGRLHWIVTPVDPERRQPTFATNVLLHFTRARLRVATRPRRLVAGRRSRLRVKVTFARGGPARGAKVHVRGRVRRTNAAGVARFTVRPRHRGRLRVRATRPGAIAGSRRVRVVID